MLFPSSISRCSLRAVVALALAALLLVQPGCESVSSRVSERFAPVPPQTRMVQASAEQAYVGVQQALRRMNFTITRTAAAQGRVEGRSRILPASSMGGAQQLLVEITLAGPAAGPTEVAMRLTEVVEGDFQAGPTQRPLPTHGTYDMFYAVLERVLSEDVRHEAERAAGQERS